MGDCSIRGMGVALVTPFTKTGEIDSKALNRLLDLQLEAQTDYLVVLGTTGETPTLDLTERRYVVDLVLERVGGKIPLVLGLGGNCTRTVMREMQQFDVHGFEAILSVTPFYNKPSQEGLYRHYGALSEVCPIPLMMYNVPGRTGVNLLPETTLKIARDFPNIVGIKEASGKIDQIVQIIKQKPANFHVISGDDADAVSVIKAGGEGVISVVGNALPKQFKQLIDHLMEGKIDLAVAENLKFEHLYELLFRDGNPAGIKCLLSHMGMIENVLRLPLVSACTRTSEEIEQLLTQF